MPIGYLIAILIAAVPVAVLLLPDRLPHGLRRRTFVVTMTFSELPLHLLVLFAGSTVVAVVDDGLLRTAGGWIVLAAALVVAAGFAELIRRALSARALIDDALARSPYGRLPPRSAWSGMPRLVLPFSRRPGAVERIGGIAYGEHPQQVLDVYRLRGTAEAAPVMIFLHAGGYFTGSRRREGRALLYRMALRGWVCVSADYRLMPEATWPDHLVDAKRVIAWVRGEGTRRGIHPTAVTVVGSSAGAHMAALCAVLPDRPALQPGFESADTSIDAAVCLYGYYGRYYGLGPDPQLPSSPFDVDAADAPPCMVVHGDHDGYAPVAPARAFVRHLRDSSPAPVVYAELPSGEHGFDTFASARGAAVVDGAELFLTEAVGAA